MRKITLLTVLAALAVPLAACAQPYYGPGYSYGYGGPDPYWERRREAHWERRREREEWRRHRDWERRRDYDRW